MDRAGLYIHIPFCSSRCGYCHFATSVADEQDRYVDALLREIEEVSPRVRSLTFDTVYFGGGTPSLLRQDLFGRLIAALRSAFAIENPSELTIEANPERAGGVGAHASFYAACGVNRISVGVQSAVAEELMTLDRSHHPDEVEETVSEVRKSIRNVNLDFIIGIPGQSSASLQRSLDLVGRLRPSHVSLYILEIFHGTTISRLAPPDDELVEQLYFQACTYLLELSYRHYEICNFALKGNECVHNQKYWTGSPYVGLGLSACSFHEGIRTQNSASMAGYVNDPSHGRVTHRLDPEKVAGEAIFLALRTSDGFDARSFAMRHGFDPYLRYKSEWDDLLDLGLVAREGDRYYIPEKRMLLANEVFARFV